MPKKKSQDTQNLLTNKVLLVGKLTQKGDLEKSAKGNIVIKFVLSDTAFCVASNDYAKFVNVLEIKSTLLIEGEIVRVKNQNLIYAASVECYTTQATSDTKKIKKDFKKEKTKF